MFNFFRKRKGNDDCDMSETKKEENVPLVGITPNKRHLANIGSKKWFCYLDGFFKQGWKHGINENDISLPQEIALFIFKKTLD